MDIMANRKLAFVGEPGVDAQTSTRVQNQKPTVVIMGHQHWLISMLANATALREYVSVRDLVRESCSSPVTEHEVEEAMQGAGALILDTCPASMHASTEVALVERHAVELACQANLPIVLTFGNGQEMRPPYLWPALKAKVRIVATFGLDADLHKTGYHAAWHTDLFSLPPDVQPEVHAHFRRQQNRRYFPGNVRQLGHVLAEHIRTGR